MLMVRYKVAGYGDRVFSQGPYPPAEVEAQRSDIAGFEGVHSVKVEDETTYERMTRGIGPDGACGIQKF